MAASLVLLFVLICSICPSMLSGAAAEHHNMSHTKDLGTPIAAAQLPKQWYYGKKNLELLHTRWLAFILLWTTASGHDRVVRLGCPKAGSDWFQGGSAVGIGIKKR
uniref:Uncharacterized protein n=1 Tax=Anopheles atroparvus TaxID=41427 RepID=A0A182IR38_ANOAO